MSDMNLKYLRCSHNKRGSDSLNVKEMCFNASFHIFYSMSYTGPSVTKGKIILSLTSFGQEYLKWRTAAPTISYNYTKWDPECGSLYSLFYSNCLVIKNRFGVVQVNVTCMKQHVRSIRCTFFWIRMRCKVSMATGSLWGYWGSIPQYIYIYILYIYYMYAHVENRPVIGYLLMVPPDSSRLYKLYYTDCGENTEN